ncbi:MAG: abortive infection family protein [Bacteroidales bacterium]|nr:abortive infection family protein [Bacteroidales bacterium]
MDYSLLINKQIIGILIVDTKVYNNYSLPYLSGPQLCDLSTSFGLTITYEWGRDAHNKSRWEYMQDLLTFLNEQGRVPELLSFIMQKKRFDKITGISSVEQFNELYESIIKGAIDAINVQLIFSKVELRFANKKFFLVNVDEEIILDIPILDRISPQYIKELPDRIKNDLDNNDYDSVITKSRTLLEEVMIYIIEEKTGNPYSSNGKLEKIYQDATTQLNMQRRGDWDKRINDLLGGLHRIISAISSMRNIGGDAHGVGTSRVSIQKHEALLVYNASMLLAQYWLAVLEIRN